MVALYAAAAFFAAVTQSPLTSVAIVLGLITDRRDIIPGLLMAVLIAWTLSRALCPEPTRCALARCGFGVRATRKLPAVAACSSAAPGRGSRWCSEQ